MTLSVEKLKEFKAGLIGEKVGDDDSSLEEIEKLLPITDDYRNALIKIGGGIFFQTEVLISPYDSIPSQLPDGTMPINLLFGLGRGQHGILKQLDTFKDYLPVGAIPIGDGKGGDLYVADENGMVFFWDHETDRMYRVAMTLDDFFSGLKVAEET